MSQPTTAGTSDRLNRRFLPDRFGSLSRLFIVICLCLIFSLASSVRSVAEDELFSTKSLRGGKNWAILIGVNYTSRQDELRDGGDHRSREALPVLSNAANDALSIAKVLANYYDYDADHVIVLTDDKGTAAEQLPTKSNIDRELLRVSKEAGEEDTVFFFFAGHGIKLESQSTSGNNVAMLALDVELQEGDPIGNMFQLPFGLIDDLGRIKAKQKLLVLDCCHSGEIFNQHRGSAAFQPTSQESRREDKSVLGAPAFQAMASCRASQLASDGRGGNSTFTSAFLHGLRRLPAQNQKSPITAHVLLRHLKGYFDESQHPDLRSMIVPSGNEGEFAFKPRREADFKKFLVEEREEAYLRGMVVSRQGSWWFKECPWFIPSVRDEMVRIYDSQQVVSRGNRAADLLDAESLRQAADRALRQMQKDEGVIAKLRRKHGRLLLDADSSKKLREALAEIQADLDPLLPAENLTEASRGVNESLSPTNRLDKSLKAADVHLLAVVKHSLHSDQAARIYKQALRMYATEMGSRKTRSPVKSADTAQENFDYSRRFLTALCRVDFAQYLQGGAKQHKLAAEQYQQARGEIERMKFDGKQKGYADFFMAFALCGEADAWIGINRWKQADTLLDQAKSLAETENDGVLSPVAGHFLHAHVYRRIAWCKMMQWKIKDAMCSFRKSNEILVARMSEDGPDSDSSDDSCTLSYTDELPAGWKDSTDYSSKVAFLHNLHGIAMGLRFQGNTEMAADEYRQLTRNVEAAFSQFRSDSADAGIETQFVDRTINTQERLGDCNLFGNPEVRDLKEALDDYRRAMMRVHLLRDSARDRYKAILLYKQALTLSLPSPSTDHELAMQMCQVADEIYRSSEGKTDGLLDALGTLTTLCVQACEETTESKSALTQSTGAQAKLRDCILAYRDKVGTTPHRDQLELCLFASDILLKYAGQRTKYQTIADADLLLSFCRIALESYEGPNDSYPLEREKVSDAVRYLRPYFDTAMRAKMKLGDSQVKEMLQIQAEATLGSLDLKEKGIRPILAVYVLDNKPYLLVDIPRSLSRCVPLAESYYNVEMVRNASYSETKLPLPDEIRDALSNWMKQNSTASSTPIPDCRWCDAVRGFDNYHASTTTVIDSTTGEEKDLPQTSLRSSTFPFELHRR